MRTISEKYNLMFPHLDRLLAKNTCQCQLWVHYKFVMGFSDSMQAGDLKVELAAKREGTADTKRIGE